MSFDNGSMSHELFSLFQGFNNTSVDYQGLPVIVPSLENDSDSHSSSSGPHSPEATPAPESHSTKQKRKPATRRDPQARREQNRNAQRAFRDRKERRMFELEQRCDSLEQLVREQRESNARLQQTVASLRMENTRLRRPSFSGASSSPSPPLTDTLSASLTAEPLSLPLFGANADATLAAMDEASLSAPDISVWPSALESV